MLATDMILIPLLRPLLLSRGSAMRKCCLSSRWAIRAFPAGEGPWQEPCDRVAVSLTTLGPRGSHRHAWYSQEPGPPRTGKAVGELTIHPHLWGPAVWHTNIICLRSGS